MDIRVDIGQDAYYIAQWSGNHMIVKGYYNLNDKEMTMNNVVYSNDYIVK